MNIRDIMLDAETFGLKVNAPIVQIGAIGFDRDTGETGPGILLNIDLDDALRHGVADGETLARWLVQGDEARQGLLVNPLSRKEALGKLRSFCNHLRLQAMNPAGNQVRVWACGATFDIAKLEYQYEVLGENDQGCLAEVHVAYIHDEVSVVTEDRKHEAPWIFNAARDTRTIEDVSPIDRQEALAISGWDGSQEIHHNALSDAKYQVAYLVPMLNALKGDRT